VRWPVALFLIALGVRQRYRQPHFRWASIRVGLGGLPWWSFLMASAHGAGLMVLPVFLSMTTSPEGPACHQYAASAQATSGASATLAHGVGCLEVDQSGPDLGSGVNDQGKPHANSVIARVSPRRSQPQGAAPEFS
jgi:hypothetical protein